MRELHLKAMLIGLRRLARRDAVGTAAPHRGVAADPVTASAATVAPVPRPVAVRDGVSPPKRVLLATNDRRFRAVTSALLSQRGYTVTVSGLERDIAELALSHGADVVLIDASDSLTHAARTAAKLASLVAPVAIVAVSAEPLTGLAALPVLPKWTSFDLLLQAVARASGDAPRDEVAGVH